MKGARVELKVEPPPVRSEFGRKGPERFLTRVLRVLRQVAVLLPSMLNKTNCPKVQTPPTWGPRELPPARFAGR